MKKISFLALFLMMGVLGVREKTQGAVSCGDTYAGIQGTCMGGIVSCPDGFWLWSYFSSLTNCESTERCCIQNTDCKEDGSECITEGYKGACENGLCIEGKKPGEPPSITGGPCGPDKLGTCYYVQSSFDDCSDVVLIDGDGHLRSEKYGDSEDCADGNICCVDECFNKTDGTTCHKDLIGMYFGTCLNGICQDSTGKEGSSCGSKGGKCAALGSDCTKEQQIDADGVKDCASRTCCIPKPSTSTSCGTKEGYCAATSTCSSEYLTDPDGASTCSPNACCYKENASPGTTEADFNYDNPLEVKSFSAWAAQLLTSIQGIIGWLAVVMIMIGGIVYLTSAGTNQAALGKEIITAALIGFAVAVAGPSLLKEIKDVASTSGTTASDAIDNAKDIKSIFSSVLSFLLTAVGTLALIGIAVGGIFFLTAFGDKGKAETGKKMVVNSLYAVALAGGGLILVNQILSLLGG